MFIQIRGPLAACLLNDYVLKKLFVENLGALWSSGAWGPGPNGPVVDPPLPIVTFDRYIGRQQRYVYMHHYSCYSFILITPAQLGLMQDSLNMPKLILLANIKQHVKLEIAMYAKNSPIQLCEQFPESIEPHASSVYINRFSVVVCNLYHM